MKTKQNSTSPRATTETIIEPTTTRVNTEEKDTKKMKFTMKTCHVCEEEKKVTEFKFCSCGKAICNSCENGDVSLEETFGCECDNVVCEDCTCYCEKCDNDYCQDCCVDCKVCEESYCKHCISEHLKHCQ